MILIISEEKDRSTSDVIKYLKYSGACYLRINKEDEVEIHKFVIEDNIFQIIINVNNRLVNLDEINCYWYRRGYINLNTQEDEFYENEILNKLIKFKNWETNILERFIYFFLSNKNHIGNPWQANVNKLQILYLAGKVGLKIPDTIITNSSIALNTFLSKHNDIITKPIYELPQIDMKYNISFLTKKINPKKLPIFFSYSLFQENINKEFEIRTFYLNEKCYSMAIFSQRSYKNKVDFRNYDNSENLFICEPYKLPKSIENKIIKLNKILKLECTSTDLIYRNNEYILLEINPCGQFGMVSYSCNYNLEKLIAEYLIHLSHDTKTIR